MNKKIKNKRIFSASEQEFISAEYLKGTPVTKIKQTLGYKGDFIPKILKDLGFSIRPTGEARLGVLKMNISQETKDSLIKEYLSGSSCYILASKYKISPSVLYRRFKEWGTKMRPLSASNRIYPIKEETYFDVIDTEDKAYLLGLLYADGCNTCGRIILGLQAEDKHILDYFNNIIQPSKPLEYASKANPKWKDMYRLAIHSKYINKQLSNLGIVPRKTYTISFPESISPNLFPHFIRGYFDGDGCVMGPNGNVLITMISSSPDFITRISSILNDQNIKNHILPKYNSLELRVYGNNMSRRMLEYMYKGSKTYFHRKYNKAVEYLKQADLKEICVNQFSERYPFTSDDLLKCTRMPEGPSNPREPVAINTQMEYSI